MKKGNIHLYAFVIGLLIAGYIFGMIFAHNITLDQQQVIADEIAQYIHMLQQPNEQFAVAFLKELVSQLKWLLLIWILGITVIGAPLSLVCIFLKGAMLGFTMMMFIEQYHWKGVAFSILATAPHNILMLPALVIVTVAAMRYSWSMVQKHILQHKMIESHLLLRFTNQALMMIFVFVLAIVIKTYLSPSVVQWAATYVT